MKRFLFYILCTLLLGACSTTKKLAEGEVLYTGVKKIEIEVPPKMKLKGKQKSAIKSPLSVPPNNPLISPGLRTPIPTGLWVYNWNIKREKGMKWWLYRQLAKKPILISNVQPELRSEMVKTNLRDFGIFNVESGYEVVPHKRNPRKAKVRYKVKIEEKPFNYSAIEVWDWPERMDSIVSASMINSRLKVGDNYDIYLLAEERRRISEVLRNHGYYYFNENYIEYLADTVRERKNVSLRVTLKDDIPEVALHPYKVKNVNVSLGSSDSGQQRDTVMFDSIRIDYAKPMQLELDVVARAIKMRPGQEYSMFWHDMSWRNFVQLGVFRSTNFTVSATDTITSRNLDFKLSSDFALPIQTEVELNVSSKSNNLLGPALTLSVTNNNFRKRAQILSVKLYGAYEWQVGGEKNINRSDIINTYELGINLNLAIPQIVPKFLYKGGGVQEYTQLQVGADFLNRNSFFRMISTWGSLTYDLNKSRKHYHSIVPLKINYTHLLRTSNAFDSTLSNNRAIELSFRDQLIPSMSYSYTFDRGVSYWKPNRLIWKNTIMQAGNITSWLFKLAGEKGDEKELFGNVYSQFLKFTTELIKYKRINEKSLIVMRLMGGIGYAYGNSRVMPYSEQFYSGGSNSLRGFQIRSIGPGSYHPIEESLTSYLDQTGDIKLEANLEYRFTLAGKLKGALFADAGNIWLLRNDEMRPGGQFRLKNLVDELALNTGLGIRYDISYLAIRADLGIALHSPYDTGQSGYFNIKSYGFKDGMILNIAIGYPF